jgi:hypothetical protein
MTVCIYAYDHGDGSKDLSSPKFKKLINDADIVLIENGYFWFNRNEPELLELHYNLLSQTGESEYGPIQQFPYAELANILKNSKKDILIERSPISLKEYNAAKNQLFTVHEHYLNGRPELSFESMLSFVWSMTDTFYKRDLKLADQLSGLCEETDGKNIVLVFGAWHAEPLEHLLEKKDIPVKIIKAPGISNTFFDEISKAGFFNRKIDKQTLAKSVPESVSIEYLSKLELPPYNFRTVSHAVADKLDYKKVCEISFFVGNEAKGFSENAATQIMLLKLKELGYMSGDILAKG